VYGAEKPTLAMSVITMCSFMLKGPLRGLGMNITKNAKNSVVNARVEGPGVAKRGELSARQDLLKQLTRRVREQLSNIGADTDTWLTNGEKLE
jgi:hypothetical protein